jgi:molybdenum cofactor synthesis domain-containing protein
MRVAVITVGDELLAGDTVNTNAAWLGRELAERGVDVDRVVVVPDEVPDIAREVNERRAEFDAVIVTGGLGPTHDDVTMAGVAAALGVPVEEHDDAVSWFEEDTEYAFADLVDGTADLPRGARMLPNPEGVAPGAVVEGEDDVPVYVLPGVPEEMEAMFDRIADEFAGVRRERAFVETTEPESALLDRFAAVQEHFDVTIGSYPGERVRITVEGEDWDEVDAAADWLRERLE